MAQPSCHVLSLSVSYHSKVHNPYYKASLLLFPHASNLYWYQKHFLVQRWSRCHRWVLSCELHCGLWCPCVGEMNVLACSYHCWFPGRLNGWCSGAARMNGWPLSSHDNLLPTALILHRGHWSASYWFFLFLFSPCSSFSSSLWPSFSVSLFRSVSPGQEDQVGGDGQLQQQPPTWRAKRREWRPQPRTGWVVAALILYVCDMLNYTSHVPDAMSVRAVYVWLLNQSD